MPLRATEIHSVALYTTFWVSKYVYAFRRVILEAFQAFCTVVDAIFLLLKSKKSLFLPNGCSLVPKILGKNRDFFDFRSRNIASTTVQNA